MNVLSPCSELGGVLSTHVFLETLWLFALLISQVCSNYIFIQKPNLLYSRFIKTPAFYFSVVADAVL